MPQHHGDHPPTPTTTVTQADLDSLARRLDDLNLLGTQKTLLSAIVSTAARAATEPKAASIPSFREQFATAFTPDTATRLISLDESHRDISDDPPPLP